jgi:hypothetical protein
LVYESIQGGQRSRRNGLVVHKGKSSGMGQFASIGKLLYDPLFVRVV